MGSVRSAGAWQERLFLTSIFFHLDAIDDRGCEPIPLAFDTDKGDNAGAFFAIPLEGGIE